MGVIAVVVTVGGVVVVGGVAAVAAVAAVAGVVAVVGVIAVATEVGCFSPGETVPAAGAVGAALDSAVRAAV